MNTKQIGITTLLAACSVCACFAEVRPDPQSTAGRQSAATEKSITRSDSPAKVSRKASDNSIVNTGNSDVFEGIFIDAGKTINLDSTLDYSSATTVAIGIQCIVCDSSATSLGTSGLVLLARWAVPNAEMYVTTENKTSTLFPYWDAGGVIFNVYGSSFRLSLQNKGSQPISIEQIIVFRRN